LCRCGPRLCRPKSEARQQFERAVRIRTALQERPEKDRTLAITSKPSRLPESLFDKPQAEKSSCADCGGELYQQMGGNSTKNIFSPHRYLQFPAQAISRDSLTALSRFSIAQIQKDDLGRPESCRSYLQGFSEALPEIGEGAQSADKR